MSDVAIDTHFVKRGRIGRLFQAVVSNPKIIGLGLGEDTGLLISAGDQMEALGSGLVILVDGRSIKDTNITDISLGEPISIENLIVHVMSMGDTYRLSSNKFKIRKKENELVMRILIHGGFFSESSQSNETKHKKQQALLEILNQGKDFLKNHSALETAVYTAKLLEDNPLFNAGIGSQIQSDGKIRMSAALMDGVNQKFSGVINIEDIQNPVLIAQKLMKEEDRVLGGIGATNYAKDAGFPIFSTETAERRQEFEAKKAKLSYRNNWMCRSGSKRKIGSSYIDWRERALRYLEEFLTLLLLPVIMQMNIVP
jgi:hypothetical protein